MAHEDLVIVTDEGAVRTLTLNAPKARNSLSQGMLSALGTALDDANADMSVRAIIIAATGPAFCAGHNLKEIIHHKTTDDDGGHAYSVALLAQCAGVMKNIVRHRVPVIAQVQAIATAAGCQLVASCDLALCADDARFATPGVNIGLFCSTPMVALSRNVTPKHAMEMLLTGDMISAAKAEQFGLVNRVCSPHELASETMALAQKIAAKSSVAIKFGKPAFYQQHELGLDEAYDFASEVMLENLAASEADEGISAFIEKRDPKWTGS